MLSPWDGPTRSQKCISHFEALFALISAVSNYMGQATVGRDKDVDNTSDDRFALLVLVQVG